MNWNSSFLEALPTITSSKPTSFYRWPYSCRIMSFFISQWCIIYLSWHGWFEIVVSWTESTTRNKGGQLTFIGISNTCTATKTIITLYNNTAGTVCQKV
jgi:hypothetical protein